MFSPKLHVLWSLESQNVFCKLVSVSVDIIFVCLGALHHVNLDKSFRSSSPLLSIPWRESYLWVVPLLLLFMHHLHSITIVYIYMQIVNKVCPISYHFPQDSYYSFQGTNLFYLKFRILGPSFNFNFSQEICVFK